MDGLPVRSSNLLRSASGSVFLMMKKRPHTTETLARKLNYLMDKHGYSERDMEQKSGVSAKTVNNMRNAKHKPAVENVDKVAAVFGLPGWLLITPDIPDEIMDSQGLKNTLKNYAAADASGREAIERIAEREALYNTKQ